MSSHRPRAASPSRYLIDNRSTNGPVYSTGFDDRFGPSRRGNWEPRPSHRSADSSYNAQPISTKTYNATPYGPAQTQTKYVVRARRNSSVDNARREPLRIMPAPLSPTRDSQRAPAYDRPRSPVYRSYYPPSAGSRQLFPAVSGRRDHRRQFSDSPATSYHLQPESRDYRGSTYPRPGGYSASRDLLGNGGEDGYSYITPEQHFARDVSPPRRRARRGSYTRGDRPASTTDFESWRWAGEPRQQRDRDRELGPSAALRQLNRRDDEDWRVYDANHGNHSDNERDYDAPRRRSSMRAPVALHQAQEGRYLPGQDERPRRQVPRYELRAMDGDVNYSSERENHRSSKHHERHPQRPRLDEEDRKPSDGNHGAVAVGLGGAAAAGLATALVRRPKQNEDPEPDDHYSSRSFRPEKDKTRRNSSREAKAPREVLDERSNGISSRDSRKDQGKLARSEKVDGENRAHEGPDGGQYQPRERRRHHHHHPGRNGNDSDSLTDDQQKYRSSRKSIKNRDSRNSDTVDPDELHQSLRPPSQPAKRTTSHERHRSSPQPTYSVDEDRDQAPKQLQLVEPTDESATEPKLKGILKAPRTVPFPEDPNPTRDGVATFKNAEKPGVPEGARWTKINRIMVNTAALEEAQERYEEREDYLIVLRALSPEEVHKLMALTAKIREAREREWLERQDRRRSRRADDYHQADSEREEPLAIEAGPAESAPIPRQDQPQSHTGQAIPAIKGQVSL